MADQIELEEFLKSCGNEGVLENFQNNGVINISILSDIACNNQGDDFKELVPNMGARAKIKRLSQRILVPQTLTKTIDEEPPIKFIIIESIPEDVPNNKTLDNKSFASQDNFNLSQLLDETVVGRAINCMYLSNQQAT